MAETEGRTALQVKLVSASKLVWTGEATQVTARTTEGDVGILRGHSPMLAVLQPGVVEVTSVDNERWAAAIDGGFLSVSDNKVSVLAEYAELSADIDVDAAKADLERARAAGDDEAEVAAAEARVRAAEMSR